jgi:CheY-like chemotaxis protein
MGYPDFIRDELPPDHKALPYLDDMERAARKIADINQELLTLSRRGFYNRVIMDLNPIVLRTIKEIQPLASEVAYDTKLPEDLMPIKGGNAQIHRILNNLLMNAADAVQNTGRITVTTENYYADDTAVAFGRVPKGEYVKMTVTDTGCGIPEEIAQKIFDPFFTTKTTDKTRGSGLGLSVVDSVMKDHDGYIDMKSTVGQGSSFYLYFPIARDRISNGDELVDNIGGNETVLIIDDDRIQREVSAAMLGKLGYKVTTIESGEKAVDLLRKTPHDLLILDMIMPPGIDGAETYRRVLAINPDQKAIIVSGFSESKQTIETQRLGAGAFIKKPLSKVMIAAAVRKELDRQPKSSMR